MEPRLKTSTQWTSFPEELIQQIIEAAEDHFSDYEKGDRSFIAEGRIYPSEIVLRMGLTAPKGQLRQDNFEASMEYDVLKVKALDEIHFLVDFLAETWATFFEDAPEDQDLSRLWLEHTFEKKPIYLRYNTENTDLEKLANELLKTDEKQLVYGEPSYEAETTAPEAKMDDLH